MPFQNARLDTTTPPPTTVVDTDARMRAHPGHEPKERADDFLKMVAGATCWRHRRT